MAAAMLLWQRRMGASRIPNGVESVFPANGSPRQKFEAALRYAALAPSETKGRHWNAQLTDSYLELRTHPVAHDSDPDGRETMISCGAALLYLKLALKHFACLGRIALFPELNQPSLAARVHIGFCGERDAEDRLLFEAMIRSANPWRVGEPPVSATTLDSLNQAVAGERGWLDFVTSETSRQRVIEIAFSGGQGGIKLGFSRGHGASSVAGWKTLRWPRTLFAFRSRTEASQNLTVGPVRERSVPAMTLAVVKTKTDDKYGWLAAGQTMARAVLQAQALGLPWTFFNQIRRRETREALRLGIGRKGFAQVILRFGSLASGPSLWSRPSSITTAAQSP